MRLTIAALLVLLPLAAPAAAQSPWARAGSWLIVRGEDGCGAYTLTPAFISLTQRRDGTFAVSGKVASGAAIGDRITLVLPGVDANNDGYPDTQQQLTGKVADRDSIARVVGTGDAVAALATATTVRFTSARGETLATVPLDNARGAMAVVRRCLTEIGRIDPGSGRPAASRPVLTTPATALIGADDYPPRALRDGAQGAAGVTLTISAKGLVSECHVTTSSGHAALDEQTCQSLSRRARFTPATDAAGKPTQAEVTRQVRWVLPPD